MPANLLPVCWDCHTWIHDIRHQALARLERLLVLPGDPEFDELALAAAA